MRTVLNKQSPRSVLGIAVRGQRVDSGHLPDDGMIVSRQKPHGRGVLFFEVYPNLKYLETLDLRGTVESAGDS